MSMYRRCLCWHKWRRHAASLWFLSLVVLGSRTNQSQFTKRAIVRCNRGKNTDATDQICNPIHIRFKRRLNKNQLSNVFYLFKWDHESHFSLWWRCVACSGQSTSCEPRIMSAKSALHKRQLAKGRRTRVRRENADKNRRFRLDLSNDGDIVDAVRETQFVV